MRGSEFPPEMELQKELPQSGFILANVRIDLAVSALEIRVAYNRRAAVSGAGHVNHVQSYFLITGFRWA